MRFRFKYLCLAKLIVLLFTFTISCRTCNCPAYSEAKNTFGSPHLQEAPSTSRNVKC